MTRWLTTMQKTHNTCVWTAKPRRDTLFVSKKGAYSYYVMAILKELGEAKCVPELNCDQSRLHPTMPSNCVGS